MATAAAAAGWDVGIVYGTDLPGAQRTAESVRAHGREALVVRADVGDETSVLALFDAIDSAWGGLDCLVNNVGIAPGYGPFEHLTADAIERTMRVNVGGTLLSCREAIRRMATDLGGNGGSIVNISSKAAVLGGPGEWVHYAASKGAVDSMTVGLAKEFAARGVRVNAVRPGLVEGGFGPWDPPDRLARMAPGVPIQRPGTAAEVAAAVLFLASPAASYITGAVLDVTGGR